MASRPRKLWSTTLGDLADMPDDMQGFPRRRHESQAAAYREIENDARKWSYGALTIDTVLVWVDEREGHGWQLYETINLRDY